ncbi:MAG: sigma-70 family RNA polymerase sigma factor [Actinobacteria bacterium]|nr:sigma-70 family RNA polymerase sigma factor [Actinomycetota bacterium]
MTAVVVEPLLGDAERLDSRVPLEPLDLDAAADLEAADDAATGWSMRDERGFVTFYEASYARIVGQILVVVGSRAEAEDITQEAFIRAAARWDRISEYDAPEAWVRRVAMNLAINTVQRTRRRTLILMRGHRETTAPEPSIERVALADAMARLPLRYRAVIALHYMADLSVQQVADELDLPPATVRTRLARGRRRLAELLDDSLEPSPGEVPGA